MNIDRIYKKFPTQDDCLKHIASIRWKVSPFCPYCKSTKSTKLKNGIRFHCNNCNTSYSVTVGTLFHDTKLDLQKWFFAIYLILNSQNRISTRMLSQILSVNKNTGWLISNKIRRAMLQDIKFLTNITESIS